MNLYYDLGWRGKAIAARCRVAVVPWFRCSQVLAHQRGASQRQYPCALLAEQIWTGGGHAGHLCRHQMRTGHRGHRGHRGTGGTAWRWDLGSTKSKSLCKPSYLTCLWIRLELLTIACGVKMLVAEFAVAANSTCRTVRLESWTSSQEPWCEGKILELFLIPEGKQQATRVSLVHC